MTHLTLILTLIWTVKCQLAAERMAVGLGKGDLLPGALGCPDGGGLDGNGGFEDGVSGCGFLCGGGAPAGAGGCGHAGSRG